MEDVCETQREAAKCQRVKKFSLSLPPSLMHKHKGLTRNIHREHQLLETDKQCMIMDRGRRTQNVWL